MGPSKISLKDETINNLKAQVEAHKTKTGLLQQRLASALASLDHVQNQHLLELDNEQVKRKHAEAKLRRYIDVVQATEAERDDLRDAVMKLVVKVESENNNFKTWPRSYMQITSPLDPLASTGSVQPNQVVPKDGSDDQLLLYAGAVIDTLRRERDLARAAHEHTRQIFQDRIDNLEAQLARRDAELEACGGDVEPPMLEASSALRKENQKGKKFRKEQVLIPQEEVLTLQQQITTRNKTLEEEIRGLFKRLEQARIAYSTSEPLPSPPAQSPSELFPAEFRRVSNSVQAPDVQSNIPLPRPQQLKTHTYQIYSNLAPSVTWSLSSTPLPLPSSSVVPVPSRVDHCINQHASHNNPNPSVAEHDHLDEHSDHGHGRHSQTASHLDHQIAALSAKIGAFKAERDALWQIIASQHALSPAPREHSPEETRATTQPPVALEEERISLRHAVCQLQEELCQVRITTEGRETELLHQMEEMGRGHRLADNTLNVDDDLTRQENRTARPDDLLDIHDGEMSMDLATPLFPVSLLPPSSPHHSRPQSRSLRSHPQSPNTLSMPLSSEEEGSQSPRMIRPRILSSPSPSLTPGSSLSATPPLSPSPQPRPDAVPETFIQTFPSSPGLQAVPPLPAGSRSTISASRASLEQVERELAEERLRLEEGEQQLIELQNVLQDLYGQQRSSSVR